MKIGRLITNDGIELSLESSQLKELNEYLTRQEINESLTPVGASGTDARPVLDPEEYERVVQAVQFAHRGFAHHAQTAF